MGSAETSNFIVSPWKGSNPMLARAAYEEPFHSSYFTSQSPANMKHFVAYPTQSQWNGTMHPPPMHSSIENEPGLLSIQHGHEFLPHHMSEAWVRRYSNFQVVGTDPSPPHLLDHNFQHVYQPRAPLAAQPRVPRGPPRKPQRSGHAIWVGNLPPTTTITKLKDVFSNGCPEIESVFYIRRSNCAFVNYRTEQACREACAKFHSSKLQGRSLACKLRSEERINGRRSSNSSNARSRIENGLEECTAEPRSPVIVSSGTVYDSSPTAAATSRPPRIADKYFILKSFTIQDLDDAVRRNTWATQPQNEASLNEAFWTAENVYLIFSVNKSGEYFGYARMSSPIPVDRASSEGASVQHDSEHASSDSTVFIPTPATPTAPKGRIVDDAARGTMFWEAERPDGEDAAGHVFDVEWISTVKVPFYITRGLRNRWNANREVKIARDGTEIPPEVGRRLLGSFRKFSAEYHASIIRNS